MQCADLDRLPSEGGLRCGLEFLLKVKESMGNLRETYGQTSPQVHGPSAWSLRSTDLLFRGPAVLTPAPKSTLSPARSHHPTHFSWNVVL